MASKTKEAPTNERIVSLLDEVRAQLAAAEKRDERIARDLARLLGAK